MTVQFSSHESSFAKSPEALEPHVRFVPSKSIYRSVFKRFIDTVITLLAAPFVLIIVLILAALIALDGHNPFYSQLRLGRNGRAFRMWKLRTMVWDADDRLEAYLASNPEARAEWISKQKLRSDPRITPIGRFLRKASLDELPQLLNVFFGHMALVGPRPIMVSQRKKYSGKSYYNLRPGITGLWQVSDRNDCEFSGRVYYDDLYDDAVSFSTDFNVLVRTLGVVFKGTGQ